MKNVNPTGVSSLSSTVRARGRPSTQVATTIAVGSASSPRSRAANASSSQRRNSAYGSAGTADSSR